MSKRIIRNKWDIINWIELLEFIPWRHSKSIFKCHCWKIFECRASSIFYNHTKSCWCLQTYNRMEYWVSLLNSAISKMISHMKKRWIECELTKDEIYNMIQKPCIYCWEIWWNICRNKSTVAKEYFYNWLDRVDSNLWYTIDNTVPCCKKCNWAKNSMPVNEFLYHIEKIYLFNKIKYEKTCINPGD